MKWRIQDYGQGASNVWYDGWVASEVTNGGEVAKEPRDALWLFRLLVQSGIGEADATEWLGAGPLRN